jgi:hypothetical protein
VQAQQLLQDRQGVPKSGRELGRDDAVPVDLGAVQRLGGEPARIERLAAERVEARDEDAGLADSRRDGRA